MAPPLTLAADSGWVLTLLWPILGLLLAGWLAVRIIGRVLFGPRGGKPLHDPHDQSADDLPDPWSESARRLKLDSQDEDNPPMEDKPPRPDDPPQ